jgi:hypothetical protein
VLHVFDHVCNLLAPDSRVVSLVTPAVGDGPFNLVVPSVNFSSHVIGESHVMIDRGEIKIGGIEIDATHAQLWKPRPVWEALHRKVDQIQAQIPYLTEILRTTASKDGLAGLVVPQLVSESRTERRILRSAQSSFEKLVGGLRGADVNLCVEAAMDLAGLGVGLTPDGDDLLLGCLLAAWVLHATHVAENIALRIQETAAQRTTALSVEWLRSAARGECAWPWHELFEAFLQGRKEAIEIAAKRILQQGHTSGSTALAGFVAVLA